MSLLLLHCVWVLCSVRRESPDRSAVSHLAVVSDYLTSSYYRINCIPE